MAKLQDEMLSANTFNKNLCSGLVVGLNYSAMKSLIQFILCFYFSFFFVSVILIASALLNCFKVIACWSSLLSLFTCLYYFVILTNFTINSMWVCVCANAREPMREYHQQQQYIWASNNVVCATSKASDQPAHTRSLMYVQSDQSLCMSLE